MRNGVGILLVPDTRWGRCDIKTVGLLANVLAQQKAMESGAYEAVFVRGNTIMEGSHTNTAAVRSGILLIHPEGPRILSGVTRQVVLELCRDLEIPCEEKPISVDHFKQATEIILLGTSTLVMPVVRIDGKAVGDGTPGPVTRRLQEQFFQLLDKETEAVNQKR
jgi:D-alanine transaminase